MSKHLLVAITPHGFGHAAQVAPVLEALRRLRPELKITLQSTLPDDFLRKRFPFPMQHQPVATDFGMHMRSAIDIDLQESARRYREFHRHWERYLVREMRAMEFLAPDLVLVDVPYLPLAAAQRAGIPAMALCSLNWADIYRYYFNSQAEAQWVLPQMEAAYASARFFFCPQPSMPMTFLANRHSVGPIAKIGKDIRQRLRDYLQLPGDIPMVLFAPGGVVLDPGFRHWRRDTGVHWICSHITAAAHPQITPLNTLPFAYHDILASVDALVGKCGYGTVAECACVGTPLLYVPRPEWPEEKYLLAWLHDHGRCAPLSREALGKGMIRDTLSACLALVPPMPPRATGAQEVAISMAALL